MMMMIVFSIFIVNNTKAPSPTITITTISLKAQYCTTTIDDEDDDDDDSGIYTSILMMVVVAMLMVMYNF